MLDAAFSRGGSCAAWQSFILAVTRSALFYSNAAILSATPMLTYELTHSRCFAPVWQRDFACTHTAPPLPPHLRRGFPTRAAIIATRLWHKRMLCGGMKESRPK